MTTKNPDRCYYCGGPAQHPPLDVIEARQIPPNPETWTDLDRKMAGRIAWIRQQQEAKQ